jgi:hypothetical protein
MSWRVSRSPRASWPSEERCYASDAFHHTHAMKSDVSSMVGQYHAVQVRVTPPWHVSCWCILFHLGCSPWNGARGWVGISLCYTLTLRHLHPNSVFLVQNPLSLLTPIPHTSVGPDATVAIAPGSMHNRNRIHAVHWGICVSKIMKSYEVSYFLIHEEIKRKLNSGNVCYNSVQNLLSSRLLSRNVKIRIYKTIILPMVLYECETRLRVFENRVLRRTVRPKMVEVTGSWKKLHNEELLSLRSSPSVIWMIKSRRMRWAGHATWIGEKRNAYRILVGKPEEKRPLGRPKRKWVDNIKMDLTEIDGLIRIGLICLRIGISGGLLRMR